MSAVDLKYLFRPKARGKVYTYYRRAGQRVKLPEPGEKNFLEEYNRVHAQFDAVCHAQKTNIAPGSFSWLVSEYRQDPKYKDKANSTRAEYNRFLDEMVRRFGHLPYRRITIAFLYRLRDEKTHAPAMANLRLRIMIALLGWAVRRGHLKEHPAPAGIDWLKVDGDGAEPWSDDEIEAVKKIATPEVAFLIDLTVGTGQRRSDIVKMDHSDIEDGAVCVIQQKTKADLWIPLHPELATAVEALPKKEGPLAVSERGLRYTPQNASQAIKRTAVKAGLPDLSIHGLRKTATIRLAEAGCSNAEVKAVTGHTTDEMITKYAKKLDQRRLAQQAIDRLCVKQSA